MIKLLHRDIPKRQDDLFNAQSIENRNGILRRYFLKKFNWDLTSQKEIDKVAHRINSTPMMRPL
jgi:IS30 family transposase